ncbi:MAG: hypothetical protein WCR33_00600 [Bacilli bacterium]
MVKKYNNLKNIKNISLTLGVLAFALGLSGFLSKTYIFGAILSVLFVLSIILYTLIKKKQLILETELRKNCPKCHKELKKSKEIQYFAGGKQMSKDDYDLTVLADKEILEVTKRVCLECKYCFTDIVFKKVDNKGETKEIKKEVHINENYQGEY